MSGDCFQTAARLVLANPALTLVHGIVRAPDDVPDEPAEGKARPGEEHWHAWAEGIASVKFPDGRTRRTMVCLDLANGNQAGVVKAAYYEAGRVDETHRYTSAAARAMLAERGDWGPWVDWKGRP
jgi:hypothetical protein